jgi:glycosyltransferase involved in cell wall biosynthesis
MAAGKGLPLDGSLALVIPAHNEALNMSRVIGGCRAVLPDLSRDWTLILVDDGSTDNTVETARAALGVEASRLRVIRHESKRGYGIAVGEGLLAADTDYVGFVDGDGQFDPADLRRLAALMSEADLAAGWRQRRADPGYRLVIAGVFNVLVRLLYGIRVHDIDCGLKLMRREVLEAARPLRARSALLNTELYFKTHRSGLRIEQVPVPHYPRVAGVRSGARLVPILRAVRDLVRLRLILARQWRPPSPHPDPPPHDPHPALPRKTGEGIERESTGAESS